MAFVSTLSPVAATQRSIVRRQPPQCCARHGGGIAKIPRRAFLSLAALVAVPRQARAGLQMFPVTVPLGNDYYFLRAGETISQAVEKVARTNPVDKLSIRLHGLTPRGVQQSLDAAIVLEKNYGLGPSSWIWASQNTACQETATVVAKALRIRQEQVVPEFSFLDARGVGAFEGTPLEFCESAVAAADAQGPDTRLPRGEDGTPNESISDVFVRVRQLISKLETQYFGEQIVLIAPDSDTLSILEAALRNAPLTSHREKFYFKPGELRRVEPAIVSRS